MAAAEVITLVVALVLVFGAKPSAVGSLGPSNPVIADAPASFRALVYIALGLMTALAVLTTSRIVGTGRTPLEAARAALILIAVLSSSALAILGTYARGDFVVAIIATCASAIGVISVVATHARVRETMRENVVFAGGVLLSGSSWWLLAATTSGDVATGDPVWVTVTMIVLQAASVLAFFGFAAVGNDRVAVVRSRMHHIGTLGSATVIASVVLVLVTLRLTVLSTVLDNDRTSGDAALWTLRSPESWPHAVLVAALIVWVAVRSHHSPLMNQGFRPIVAILTGAFAYASILSVGLALSYLVSEAFDLPLLDVSLLLTCGPVDCIAGIRVVAVVSLAAFLVLSKYRNTSAFAIALVSIVFLLPGTLAPIVETAWPGGPTFWASPVEVVIAIVLICAGVLVARWFDTARAIPIEVVTRLLLYPLIVIHAVSLVPAVLGSGFAKGLSMLLVILSVLFFLPPVTSSRSRQTRVIASASCLALFAAISLVTPADSEAWSSATQITALLLLTVPVATGLVIRSVNAPPQSVSDPVVPKTGDASSVPPSGRRARRPIVRSAPKSTPDTS